MKHRANALKWLGGSVKAIIALGLMSAVTAQAEEVTSEQAQTAVRNWIRKNPRPMTAQFTTGNGKARTYFMDGRALFHVVQLEGGGFVITSGDTRISPIIAFSDSGEFQFDDGNPLVAFLDLPLRSRLDQAYPSSGRGAPVPKKALRLNAAPSNVGQEDACELAEEAWRRLLAESGDEHVVKLRSVSSQSAISDMRVPPIVKTVWGQRYWSPDRPNEAVFNYHTPTCPCGCVATAAAQVMRTMRFPEAAIAPRSFTCSMEAREEPHKMYGGTYEWDLMPYSVAEAATLSTPQKEAIGKLTWDIGAAVQMSYTSGNSTTGMEQLRSALVDVFGFKSANLLVYDRLYGTGANVADSCVLFSSLDAGLPVFGGIFQLSQNGMPAGGHCILFDGYGFIGREPYVHMNCGYNGMGDIWYAFFTDLLVEGSPYKYNYIRQIIYNVDCREAGDVISGRVLDTSGAPVPYADVSLGDFAGRTLKTAKSSSRGVWSFRVPIGPGTNFVSAATSTAVSQSSRVIRGGTVTPDGSTSVFGNRWGINLVVEEIPLEQVETPVLNPSKGGFSGTSVSVSMTCGTSGATIRYTRDGSEPTPSSQQYSSPIVVSGTTEIRAKAFKDGMRASETAAVVYEQNVFKGSSDIASAMDCSGSTFAFSSSVHYYFRGQTNYFDSQKAAECVYGQTQETFDGVDAVLLKACPFSTGFTLMWGATTELSTSVSGPGLLRFKYKLLKNVHPYGYLTCSVNGTDVASGLVEPEWTSVAIAVTGTGVNKISWQAGTYSGASTPSSINDVRSCIALDDMEWVPGTVSKRSVTYNLNGDESGLAPPAGSAVYPGDRVTVPVDAGYARSGYVFGGWNTEPDGSGKTYWPKSSFVSGESDVVLYARWCKIVEVPFDFASEGGVHGFPLKGFAGSKFHGVGTFPEWAGFAVTDANGNVFAGGSSFATLSFAAEATLHVSLGENPDQGERSFSWGVISETYDEVPMFVCRQYGDTSHVLDGLVIDGPESVVAGTSVGLSATAHYRDGTSARVSGCEWSVSSGTGYAEVSSAGLLTGKSVTEESVVTVSATYREGDVSIPVQKDFVVLPSVALGASLNAESTTFRTGTGKEAWVGQQGISADGISSARCGSCLNASPWIEFSLPKGRSVSFACRLSAGGGRNLTIYVDGEAVERFVSAIDMSDWLYLGIAAANSARTIRVVYQWHGPKGALSAEEDCAWIDYVNFGDLPPLEERDWGYRLVKGGAVVTNVSMSVTGDVVIPGTLGGFPVVAIGSFAFSDRADVSSVVFPATVTNIGFGAFLDCSGLAEITWPAALKSIDDMAFYFTGISELELPDGLSHIGEAAFELSFVRSALIPGSVTSIGASAFQGCEYLTNVTFEGAAPQVGSEAFYNVRKGCVASVFNGAPGYDVDADGKWNGLKVVRVVAPSNKVTFGKNGGTGGDDYVTATYGQPMPTPRTAPTLSGYAFGGYWDTLAMDEKGNPKGKQYYDANMKSVRKWDKKSAATLWAKWTNKVTFGKNGGTGGDSYVTCTKGQPMPKRTMPTKSGYVFDGYWSTTGAGGVKYYNADGTSAHAWDKSGSVTLWAKWQDVAVKVTLGKNGGTGGDNYVTCTKGQPMPKRTMPTKSGYVFDGYWTTTGTGGVKYYNADGTSAHTWDKSGSVTLWAKWVKPVACKVTFGKNGGTGGDNYVTATTGQPMPTPRTAPKRTGWTFAGYWDTLAQDANGNPTGKQYYDGSMKSVRNFDKSAAVTLWAKWTVRVKLGKNGGTGGDDYVTVTYNQPFPKRTMPKKSGYAFGGYWVSASSKTGQCYNVDGPGTASMKWTTGGTPTIWALWTKTSSCVEVAQPAAAPAFAAPSASTAPAAAGPAAIPAGLYSGILAGGKGTFCLLLDEAEEGVDRTAYLYVFSEGGAFDAECTVVEVGGVLVLTTEDGAAFAFDPVAGTLIPAT